MYFYFNFLASSQGDVILRGLFLFFSPGGHSLTERNHMNNFDRGRCKNNSLKLF